MDTIIVIEGLSWWSIGLDSSFQCRGAGSNPSLGVKILHASWAKGQSRKQKQYCNKFNKDFKMVQIKKKKKKKKWNAIVTEKYFNELFILYFLLLLSSYFLLFVCFFLLSLNWSLQSKIDLEKWSWTSYKRMSLHSKDHLIWG